MNITLNNLPEAQFNSLVIFLELYYGLNDHRWSKVNNSTVVIQGSFVDGVVLNRIDIAFNQ